MSSTMLSDNRASSWWRRKEKPRLDTCR